MNNHSSKVNIKKNNVVFGNLKKSIIKTILYSKRICNNITLVFDRFTKPESIVISSIINLSSNIIISAIKNLAGLGVINSVITANIKAAKRIENVSNAVITNSVNVRKIIKSKFNILLSTSSYVYLKVIKKVIFNLSDLNINVIASMKNYIHTKLISLDNITLSTLDNKSLNDVEKELIV